jgi:hypothetical protein
MSTPSGYTSHQSIDIGGRMTGQVGSGAMYDTLINLKSGPRVQGETFELHALPGNANHPVDNLSIFGSGFGGDPNDMLRLSANKGKLYEFSGLFRRDRQYFDYDLLGNPNITTGQTIPIGPSNSPVGTLAWPQVNQSPVMFNTVRRMLDTNLTLFPFATVTYRLAYSHSTFEGPSLSPSYTIAKYQALLGEYQRNGTDDFLGAIDWKPAPSTKITFEEQATHYKSDSFYTLAPSSFLAQEADGTPVSLGNWDSQVAYGISACNTGSMGTGYTNSTTYTILSPNPTSGGLPIINSACDVVTGYMRRQPTRIWTPTETLRLQSTALKNITMNGDIHYTKGSMTLPNYYENVTGLDGVTANSASSTGAASPAGGVRQITYNGGNASANRSVITANYGFVWQMNPTISLSDVVSYSSIHEPGTSYLPQATTLLTAANSETINSPITQTGYWGLPHGNENVRVYNYFGQESLVNNFTAAWDASASARFSLTYRYSNRNIGQGSPHVGAIPTVMSDPVSGTVAITENGGIFNAALRPASNWDINGTVEMLFDDNVFTPVSPRQSKQYRVHTMYKPRTWATLSAAFNDRERHNNTFNNQAVVTAGTAYQGPINHIDYSRMASFGAQLAPNEHYSVDFNYAYTDVYAATNICYNPGATSTLPGAATKTSTGAANVCTVASNYFGRDFEDAPTQSGSVTVSYTPVDKFHANAGYRVSAVNGSRFFNDARDVNGSLVSTYNSPFLNLAYTLHPGLILKADYNYYGYGEGGPSGAPYCSTTATSASVVLPCNDPSFAAYPTGLTEPTSGLTAPRTFHANNVTLGMHYEF